MGKSTKMIKELKMSGEKVITNTTDEIEER